MTAGKDNLVYVEDMLAAIDKIARYCSGVSKEDFFENEMLRDAVVRNIEILGEAASKVSADFQAASPDIAWRTIIATRNRLIHAYDVVDFQIVWDVVSSDLPVLEKKLKRFL